MAAKKTTKTAAAKTFDVAKVAVADLARLGGGPPAEE
jgi:hypothetical protein